MPAASSQLLLYALTTRETLSLLEKYSIKVVQNIKRTFYAVAHVHGSKMAVSILYAHVRKIIRTKR
jgi:hypothetical protein